MHLVNSDVFVYKVSVIYKIYKNLQKVKSGLPTR